MKSSIVVGLWLFFFTHVLSQGQLGVKRVSPLDSIRIDRVEILKNWITWDRIIMSELLFEEGEWVRYGRIDTSLNRIWNIGNFADVSYEIEESAEGNILKIVALDAVKFYPLLTIDHSSVYDYNYRFGAGDDNFLGSNSKLKIVWEKNPNGAQWEFSLGLPRQLLYKNMTTQIGFLNGSESRVFLDRIVTESNGHKDATYETRMIAPYNKTEYYVKIGNPWNLDYRYRFSPDLSLTLLKHVVNHDLLSDEDLNLNVLTPEKKYRFFNIGLSESIGTINIKRHRKDGYTAGLSYDLYAGVGATNSFHELNVNAEYHKTLSNLVQVSSWVRSGYATANDQYRFVKGAQDVIGIRKGEIFGKAYYSAYTGGHFSWVNTKWVTLENAYFVNVGNGADTYAELFGDHTRLSLGTFFEIRFPVVPIAVLRFTFMYAGAGSEWFKFNLE